MSILYKNARNVKFVLFRENSIESNFLLQEICNNLAVKPEMAKMVYYEQQTRKLLYHVLEGSHDLNSNDDVKFSQKIKSQWYHV